MFTGNTINRAEEFIHFYVSVIEVAEVGELSHYPKDRHTAKKGALMFGVLKLANQYYLAIDSGVENNFTFNEAESFMASCEDQVEIETF